MGHKSGGSKGGAWGPTPLFLDQAEARRAEKIFLRLSPSPLSQGLDDLHPRLSESLDAPLHDTQ